MLLQHLMLGMRVLVALRLKSMLLLMQGSGRAGVVTLLILVLDMMTVRALQLLLCA